MNTTSIFISKALGSKPIWFKTIQSMDEWLKVTFAHEGCEPERDSDDGVWIRNHRVGRYYTAPWTV